MPRVLMLRDQEPRSQVEELGVDQLPDRSVSVDIDYSDLNYKDALAVTGKGKIVRDYPFVPGIDFAGTVRESHSDRYAPGDKVILTGWGVGERHWGGFAETMNVDAEWLVPCPEALSPRDSMLLGTAGLTAMLSVIRLEQAGLAAGSKVLVTGATGGVGSWAVQMLAQLDYEVHAVTGKADQHAWLKELGASEIVDRSELDGDTRPLEKGLWDGAVDTVGGKVLASVLARMTYQGRVAAVGLAGGTDLPTTVMPFILRGVALLGVDSVMVPFEQRQAAWQRLAALPRDLFTRMHVEEVGLGQAATQAEAMLKGKTRGRVLINPHQD
ncbi:putative quinone oxidoreductase, YhdH/YhfP family [Modicisalibacter ilicicola DSM 19980]|uniref:Putative quinone oxidoreductase, YhdH/YhfP family n=1 Tax=Modicisalibacter ilicicola DSM 19980 TaxID=1121942 RepID=A0A1M5AZN3_9GAMM|nr:MDR family oxidoreductase [Halomonas ilicicola]SHF35669.1 putative quinone oxidoreductase, YhdH/YhfP family [Halomonas ilicicola DSM 19980]